MLHAVKDVSGGSIFGLKLDKWAKGEIWIRSYFLIVLQGNFILGIWTHNIFNIYHMKKKLSYVHSSGFGGPLKLRNILDKNVKSSSLNPLK